MGYYIERERVEKALAEYIALSEFDECEEETIKRCIRIIGRIPPADVAQVVHGKWTQLNNMGRRIVCSECGVKAGLWDSGDGICYNKTKYCPHCGSRMDGDTNA